MKCIKCKFKEKNTGACTYPFKATAVGDIKFNKDGNIIGCTHGRKKLEGNIYDIENCRMSQM